MQSPDSIECGQSDNFGLLFVVQSLLRHKMSALISFLVIVAATLGLAKILPPKYEASATLMVGTAAPSVDAGVDPAGHLADITAPFVKVTESEDVIRSAMMAVGVDRLAPAPAAAGSRFDLVNEWLYRNLTNAPLGEDVSAVDRAMTLVTEALSVKPDPKSNILRISYVSNDAALSAEFTNAVVASLINRLLALSSNSSEARFYEKQLDDLQQVYRRSNEKLVAFEVANGAYSIEEEKQLLLKQSYDLAASLSDTRGHIADLAGQRDALTTQLQDLRPVSTSQYMSSIVSRLGSGKQRPPASGETNFPTGIMEEPPVVMVRVLQDTMVALFKVDAELKGLQTREKEQSSQASGIQNELNKLANKQVEYEELKKTVAMTALSAEAYSKKALDEETNAKLNEAKFSAVKIIQPAVAPLHSTLPSYRILIALSLIGGIAGGIIVSLLMEYLFPRRGRSAPSGMASGDDTSARTRRHDRIPSPSNIS